MKPIDFNFFLQSSHICVTGRLNDKVERIFTYLLSYICIYSLTCKFPIEFTKSTNYLNFELILLFYEETNRNRKKNSIFQFLNEVKVRHTRPILRFWFFVWKPRQHSAQNLLKLLRKYSFSINLHFLPQK